MKRILSAVLSGITLILCLTACGIDSANSNEDDGKLQIVTTTFPQYDWVMEILGEKSADAEVTFLLESGVDMHSYQPSVNDILKISQCDMFVFTGGESDEWVLDTLIEAPNDDMLVVGLLESLEWSAKKEEMLESTEYYYYEIEEEEKEVDEHVWLSLKNAQLFCNDITDTLSKIDPQNEDVYRQNNKAYIEKLSALDEKYQSEISSSKRDVLLFADRFPFKYMADDYNLTCYAAFPGCSSETEASFETVTFLAEKIDSLGLTSVITIEGSDSKIADTVINATQSKNQEILTLNSMQSITSEDIENGVTYLSIMEDNLDTIKKALN